MQQCCVCGCNEMIQSWNRLMCGMCNKTGIISSNGVSDDWVGDCVQGFRRRNSHQSLAAFYRKKSFHIVEMRLKSVLEDTSTRGGTLMWTVRQVLMGEYSWRVCYMSRIFNSQPEYSWLTRLRLSCRTWKPFLPYLEANYVTRPTTTSFRQWDWDFGCMCD